jgi:hypothetical protein
VSITTELKVPTTIPESTATDDAALTMAEVSITLEEIVPTSALLQIDTVMGNYFTQYFDYASPTTVAVSVSTEETVPTDKAAHKTVEEAETTTIDELATTKRTLNQTDEAVQTSTTDPITSSTATSTATQYPPIKSNVPGITLESISVFNELPEGCFEGIGDLCQSEGVNVISCSNSTVSDQLVDQVLNRFTSSLGITFIANETDFSSSVSHSSTCEDNQEIDWVETYEITSTESREPNSTYEIAQALRTPTFTSASFLQVRINSFGTSSVQLACYFLNEEAVLEFSSVPGGIVGGYTVSEDVYDCSYYVTATVQPYVNGNSSSSVV